MSTTEGRSTRSTIKKQIPAPTSDKQEGSAAHADSESDGEYDEPQGNKRKRASKPKKHTGAKKKSKRTKKPSRAPEGAFLEIPFDIHVEIFSYLGSFELLNLGRTCKDLQGLITSREFASVWRQLRVSKWPTMPQCPDDITEPAFLQLFFGRTCMDCGILPSAHIALHHCWDARTRLCTDCIRLGWSKHNGLRGYAINFIEKKDSAISDLVGLVPSCHVLDRHINSGVDVLYSTRHINEWKAAFSEQKNAARKLEWVAQKKAQYKEIRLHAEQCANWFNTVGAAIFAAEKRRLVKQRQARVVDFLIMNGWEEELSLMGDNHPKNLSWVIKLCERKITDKVLAIHKRPFESYMLYEQKTRLERERTECVEQRLRDLGSLYEAMVYRELSLDVPHPRTGDIFAIPRFMDKVMNTPVSVKLSARHFTEIEDNFEGVMEEATNIVKTKMLALVEEGLADKTYDPNTVLDLATTAFGYRFGYGPLSGPPAILTTPEAMASHMPGHPYDLANISAHNILRSVPWNPERMKFDREAHDALCSIMTFLGLDPQTATLQDVQELDPMVECVDCNDLQRGRFVMDWRHMATHMQAYYHVFAEGTASYELLQGDDATKARAALREQTRRRLYSLNPKPDTLCTHCKEEYYQAPLDKMLWHLNTSHKIQYAGDADFKIAYQNEVQEYPVMNCRIWPPRPPTTGFT